MNFWHLYSVEKNNSIFKFWGKVLGITPLHNELNYRKSLKNPLFRTKYCINLIFWNFEHQLKKKFNIPSYCAHWSLKKRKVLMWCFFISENNWKNPQSNFLSQNLNIECKLKVNILMFFQKHFLFNILISLFC